ncbi:polysaccharide biosynthesis tyrosine autokinase [Cryomorpha ignava]|uniref:non-specific protein-tyrosine kinase n=1 Tax=Cryomorpha ignava TaxID=101383 RepID=A0A7K3WKQ9_9FLAO|nr:tyrosine-protein kinase [Cryomorpha ignava]NEN22236.1 polysaccharide biosynthesis tyrosine autokinase [Cryomorpha ignava]
MFDQKTDSKDVKALVFKYLRYWYLFAIGAVVAFIISLIYLRYTTPLYVAKTSILFKDEKGGGPSEAAVFSDIATFSASRSIENEILILKSNSLMQRVVGELKLGVNYVIEGSVRDVEIYSEDLTLNIIPKDFSPDFYGKSFIIYFKDDNSFEIEDGEIENYRFGQEITKPYGTFTIVAQADATYNKNNKPLTVSFKNVENLAKEYSAKLQVNSITKDANALSISIIDAVPARARDILSKLIEVYEDESIEDKNQVAEKSVEFIDERLKYLTAELSSVEQNVEQYKQQYELTDVSSQGQEYMAAASANRRELEAMNVQLDVLRSIENYLKSQSADEYELVPSSLTISDATLSGLITSFNAIQLDRERLLRTNKPNNPIIINMSEQLKNLRDNILENLKNIRSGLYISRRSLEAQSGIVSDKIQQVPVRERQYIEITRQQEIKQSLYLYLLQKKEEAALSLASAVANTRMIDPPTSKGPVSPNRTNVMAYSILLGIFVPFIGLFIKNLLTQKIELRSEVNKLTQTPILGEICHDKTGDIVIANAHKRTPIAEMFRLLRSNLRFSLAGKENKVILITSSMSGEGKTFFSINMAASLAGAGKKVLIMEFDLRRPKLLKGLGMPKTKGLTDYLVGDIPDVDSIIKSTDIDANLDVISAGTLPPNPAEIILNDRVAQLIKNMRERYDYILLDCPPVGKVADALTLNEHIDTAIYIVRYNYTDKDQIKIIDDIFLNQKLHNPLIVLNDSKKLNSGNYVYGY